MAINKINAGTGAFLNPVRSASSDSASDNHDFAGVLKSVSKTVDLDQIFDAAANKYGVSTSLLKAVAKAESNIDPNAVSSSGAQGVMQLMPYTAKELGVTDSFDAEQNIMGGAKLLSQFIEKYNGNTQLALAAYNAGPGNVEKYDGIPPFTETQNYVTKVMGYLGSDLIAGVITDGSGQEYGSGVEQFLMNRGLLTASDSTSNFLSAGTLADADPEELKNNMLMQIYQLEKNLLMDLNVNNDSTDNNL